MREIIEKMLSEIREKGYTLNYLHIDGADGVEYNEEFEVSYEVTPKDGDRERDSFISE